MAIAMGADKNTYESAKVTQIWRSVPNTIWIRALFTAFFLLNRGSFSYSDS